MKKIDHQKKLVEDFRLKLIEIRKCCLLSDVELTGTLAFKAYQENGSSTIYLMQLN